MDTKEALQKEGFKCDIAAKNLTWAVGKTGIKVMPDLTLSDAIESLAMYAGVAFIGDQELLLILMILKL